MTTLLEDISLDEYLKRFSNVITEVEDERFSEISKDLFKGKSQNKKEQLREGKEAFLKTLKRLTIPIKEKSIQKVKIAFSEYCKKTSEIRKKPMMAERDSEQIAAHKNYEKVIIKIVFEYLSLCNKKLGPFIEEFTC